MDRIRKALDRARVERTQADGGAARLEPVAVVEGQPTPYVAAIGEVTYRITKVFSPADEQLERNRIMRPTATGAAPAAYRMLRTQVLQRMDAQGWRTLAIFSPGPNDGKTITAINLAVSLASDPSTYVLLVDFDFKRPRVASCFGQVPEFGVDDVLAGHATVQDCLYHPDGFDRLVLLPARSTLGNSSEVLAGPRAREMVAEIRGRYRDRIIVFDLPPVLNADDALAFAPLVEAGLVVASEGRTRRSDLVRTIELLNATPIVGTVLNRAVDAPSGY